MAAGLDATPFASTQRFETAFAAGLEPLLAEGAGPGAFILVLANALTDARLRAALAGPIESAFARIAAQAQRLGGLPDAPPDDRAVMERLLALGLDALAPAERVARGPFEVRFNPVRALRPPRMTGAAVTGLHAPFDPQAFNFNKPFLLRERLWAGELLGREADLFYNKFPFVEDHLLLVPERTAGRPQLLDQMTHEFAWELSLRLGSALPGTVIAYNALGAFASVNHLHLHLCRPAAPLPIFARDWRHNAGSVPFPSPCARYTDVDTAWAAVAQLHAGNRTYHLLYADGAMLLLPRRFQGSYTLPAWAAGTTWYEMAGGVVAFDRTTFETVSPESVTEALRTVGEAG